MLRHQDGLLDLSLLNVSLLIHLNDALPVLRGNHLVVLHLIHLLLHLLIVPLLKFHDLTGALASLFNLLSRFHLLLFE